MSIGFVKNMRAMPSCCAGMAWRCWNCADHVTEQRELMHRLPNLCYLHDSSVISSHGAMLSKMSFFGRKHEEIVVKEALQKLGIPIFHEFGSDDDFEGCLLFAPDLLFLAKTERHSMQSIERFIPLRTAALPGDPLRGDPGGSAVYAPGRGAQSRARRPGAHLSPRIAAHLSHHRRAAGRSRHPALYGAARRELINVSDEEQRRWGTTFVPLEPGTIFHYDIALAAPPDVSHAARGEHHRISPDALLAGGGSLRCITLRIWRE